MTGTPLLLRTTVVAALAVCGVLTVVSVLLMPDFGGTMVERLEAVAEAGTAASVSAFGFTLSQLPFAVGALGVAHLLRGRTPVLAALAGLLMLLGAFGHAVYGGVGLTMLAMADDEQHHAVHAQILTAGERSPAMLPFLAVGVLGAVLGMILLAVALWRGRLGPRWLPVALVTFVLVEFGGAGLSRWAGYTAMLMFLVVFLALAVVVHRSSLAHWHTAAEAVQVDVQGASRSVSGP